jgi:hypothetical protein
MEKRKKKILSGTVVPVNAAEKRSLRLRLCCAVGFDSGFGSSRVAIDNLTNLITAAAAAQSLDLVPSDKGMAHADADERSECGYGKACYRLNPHHLKAKRHSHRER